MDEELRAELLARRDEDQRIRARVRSGHPQLYGTQFTYDQGQLKPHPIEDPTHLDARRAAVGLGPYAAYEVQIRQRH